MSSLREALRSLVERLFTAHRHQSVATIVLCLLGAGSEGIGFLLLIPLLASVGISTGDTDQRTSLLGLETWGLAANVYGALAVFLALLASRQLIVYRQRIELSRIGLDFSHALRAELFAAILSAEWRHFAAGTLNRRVQILTHETNSAGVAAQQFLTLASVVLLASVQIGVAIWLSATFTLAAVVGIVVFAVLFRRRFIRVSQLGNQLTQHNLALYSAALNLLPMLRTAKMAGTTTELAELFRGTSMEIARALRRHAVDQTASAVTVQVVAAFALGAALVVGVELLGLDALSTSVLILIFARLTPLLTQMQQAALQLVHKLPAVSVTLGNITEWRSRAERLEPIVEPLPPPTRVIELRNVTGGYVEADGGSFLRDITLRVPLGGLTVLSGRTGAGKSTLADIIAGLLRPTAGSIMLDGRVLSGDHLAHWRGRVGYVEQAATLFTGTVSENLRWGLSNLDAAWLERVLWATTVDEFIDAVPGGMAGSVGEGGGKLSGGQKQRLAIARELLRKPSLLVLDEATSGLDQASESRVLERILSLGDGLAVLLITHRLTARRLAHQVVELDQGRIKIVSPGNAPVLPLPAQRDSGAVLT